MPLVSTSRTGRPNRLEKRMGNNPMTCSAEDLASLRLLCLHLFARKTGAELAARAHLVALVVKTTESPGWRGVGVVDPSSVPSARPLTAVMRSPARSPACCAGLPSPRHYQERMRSCVIVGVVDMMKRAPQRGLDTDSVHPERPVKDRD